MRKPSKKLISGCMTIALTMSSAFLPALAMAATPNVPTISSDVLRLAGLDRYETAAKIAQQGWNASEYAVLSAGMDENLVDALTAAPLAKAKNAPILLSEGTSLNKFAESELLRLGVKTVYITSGTGIIQQPVLEKLNSMGIAVKSLGGKDRFETALNIAKELPKFNEIIVTTAWTNADALSVASIAAAKGVPILLSDAQSMPESVSTYVNSVKAQVAKTYVLGGTGAVSDTVKSALPSPVRLGGVDRYATNQEILGAFASDLKPGQVFVTNGQDAHLVDSLAASPLAAQSKSPVVLVDGTLTETTANFVKLNLLSNKVFALGGESVVGSEVATLTAAMVYSEDGATKGSSDATQPEVLQEVLKITGKDVSVKNVKADYSIYVQGDNVSLENVTVTGTVFVDPGETGTATLTGVTANKIVVMSGAKDSIHIVNSKAGTLLVSSDTQTRVEASGTTQVENTVVTSYAILDANGGSLGQVLVATEPGKDAVVELRGTFTEPVIVAGQATLKAAADAVVPTVVVATKNGEQKVTLDGTFKTVEIQTEAKVDLAANAKVETMETTAQATILVPPTAEIDTLEAGTTGTLVGGGGTVNDQTTTTTPTTLPPTTTTPPIGSGGGTTTQTSLINTFEVLNISTNVISPVTVNGTNATANLSSISNNDQRISALKITTTPSASTLRLTGLTSPNTGAVSLDRTLALNSGNGYSVTMTELFGIGIPDGDISVGSLRSLFGDSVIFTGELSDASGNVAQSNVTLTLTLGGSTEAQLDNEWATMTVSEDNVITATLKPGQSETLLSEMGLYSLLINSIGTLPSSVCIDDLTIWNDPSTPEGRAAIQNAIASTLASKTWENSTLGDLVGDIIHFKKQGDATIYYLVINGEYSL